MKTVYTVAVVEYIKKEMDMDTQTNSKQRIAEIGVSLMKEQGFDNVSIMQICKAADITRTTFYYHFNAKQDLIEEYFKAGIVDQEDTFSQLMQIDNDFDRYIALYDMHLRFLVEEGVEFTRQLLKTNLDDPTMFQQYILKDSWCVPILTNCQKRKLIRTDYSPEQLDTMMASMALGIVSIWCSTNGSFDLYETVHTALNAFLRA